MTNQHVFIIAAVAAATLLGACKSEPDAAPPPSQEPGKPKVLPELGPTPSTLPPPPQPGKSANAVPATRDSIRIRFGIKPGNYDDAAPGVLVEDVFPGTSAADAGIKIEDRLVTWNGQTIHDIPEWMQYMSAHKPGDVVEVGVLRNGATLAVRVTLKASQG